MPTIRTAEPRDDAFTLRDAVGVSGGESNHPPFKDISAGEQEFSIWKLMLEEYKRTGNPIPADRSAQIVYDVAGKIQNPHATLNKMTIKGLLQKVEAPTNCPRIPLSQGIRIFVGLRSNRAQVWPQEPAQEPVVVEQGPVVEEPATSKVIEKIIAHPVRLWPEGPWCSEPGTPPIRLGERRARFYQRLMNAQCKAGYDMPLSAQTVRMLMKSCPVDSSTIHTFDHHYGFMMQVFKPEHRRGMPVDRFVVFSPYQKEGSDEVVVPPECQADFGKKQPAAEPVPEVQVSKLRTKEDLNEEIQRIDTNALERGARRYEVLLTMLQTSYVEVSAVIERLKSELVTAEDKARALQDQLNEHRAQGPMSELFPEEAERVVRLKQLLDNYDLLFR